MRIGIIGSGKIGGTAARLFEAAGHDVAVANSRGEPDTAGALAGSRRQEPGSPVYNQPMTAPEAERALRSA